MKIINRALLVAVFLTLVLSSCTSVGTIGLVTKSSSDPGAVLKSGQSYKVLGPAQGEACRFFLLGIIPWGDATFSKAVDNALAEKGGDALINVTVTNSLYGFLPVFYNIFSYTCTEVKGIAIIMEQK